MKKLTYSIFLILLFSGSAWAQIAGDRTVPSDNYLDLKTVADSLNLYGVGPGGVNFLLQGGSTFEESPIEFTATGNEQDSVHISWDGQGEKPIVNFDGTEVDSEAGFTLNGVDNYTLDGIKITNSNSNLEIGILITNFDSLNGAHNNTIKNVEIVLDKLNAFQTAGIGMNAQIEPTELDGNNNNNKFFNNTISNVTLGYSFDGNTSTTSLMAVGNEIGIEGDGESTIFDIVLAGVTASDQNGFTISNTTIRDLTRIGDGNTAPAAIATSSGNPSDSLTNEIVISNNTIENMTSSFTSIFGMYLSARKVTYQIYNNKINNVTATGGGGNTADGIIVIASSAIANIYNNMVSGIAAPASAVNNNAATRGITVRTYDQANVFYNTVLLDYEATDSANTSAAFVIYNNSDPVQMRNNIFVNNTTLPSDSMGLVTAIFKRNNTWAGIMTETDNNIYYAGEPGPHHVIYYGNNSSAPNVLQTIEEYKVAADSLDQNSYTENVPFISNSDLHIPASANSVANDNGTPVTEPIAITTDFDGELRDTETPDIGADEIISLDIPLAVNPTPEDGATDVSLEMSELSWEYYTGPENALPEAFLVYLSESPDFDGVDPVATVMWADGVTDYSTTIDALNPETLYYWKVVPVTSLENGMSPEPVTVWTFTTEAFVFNYPNAAENPTPEDGGIMAITDNHILTFSWDYIPSANYSLPDHFEVYGATYMNTVAWINPVAEISYVDGQVSYTIVLTNIPNFTYQLGVDHFWKIVPISADGQASPDVPVWVFTFEEGNGVSDLSSEGTLIYPNPADDILNIEPGFEGKYEVLLYDVQGKLVKHFSENAGRRVLNIASVQAGAYQLVIKQGKSQFTNLIKIN